MTAHFFNRLSFCGGFAVGDGVELITQLAAGEEAVHFTGSVHLALDRDAAGQVLEEDAIGGFVDFLSSRSRATDEFFQKIRRIDPKRQHPLFEGGDFLW